MRANRSRWLKLYFVLLFRGPVREGLLFRAGKIPLGQKLMAKHRKGFEIIERFASFFKLDSEVRVMLQIFPLQIGKAIFQKFSRAFDFVSHNSSIAARRRDSAPGICMKQLETLTTCRVDGNWIETNPTFGG